MPRSYAQIPTRVWRDWRNGVFPQLTLAQQGVYFMLETQPDITAAGVLSLTERRWAKLSAGTTPAVIRAELDALADHGLVVVDEDTEELLLVPFVESDGGHTNQKRRPVIRDAAQAVASPSLRVALAVELDALGLTEMASELSPNSPSDRASHTPFLDSRDALYRQPEDALSGTSPDAVPPSERVGVTEVDHQGNPQPTTPERGPSGTGYPITGDEPPATCPNHPDGTLERCGPCGTARRRNETWQDQRTRHLAEQRKAEAATRRDCQRCNPDGWIEHSDTRAPIRRCDHQPEGAPTDA